MKKIFTILFAAFCVTVFAQEDVKRVAILETVDRVGDVNLGVKSLLRQSITFGINRIPGYEGYNRVDMVQITGEQNFQRTGYVSDADIKKLGVMTGAAYVLIAEATTYDVEHILVFANLVDVETGRVANSSIPKVASTAPDKMYEDCAEVAKSLLGVSSNKGKGSAVSSTLAPSDYVDLGLPSGTLWKREDENDGLIYYFNDAKELFRGKLPTQNQYRELKNYCTWTWTGDGYKVVGPNGNFIIFPASGWRDTNGQYKSQGERGWYLCNGGYFEFSSSSQDVIAGGTLTSCSVRLTKQ